ncbi:MAG TPA: hypothetical protein VJ835_02025 [Fimbriimonadaceae bacterium]|nr:hypothetical protein [Fimbriimonadaceae bacterium]
MEDKSIANPGLVPWAEIKDKLARRHALNVMIRSSRVQEVLGAQKIGRVWYVDPALARAFDPNAWTQRGKLKRAKPRTPKQPSVPKRSTCKADPIEGTVTLRQASRLVGLPKFKLMCLMRNPGFRERVGAFKPEGCTAWLIDEEKVRRELLLSAAAGPRE